MNGVYRGHWVAASSGPERAKDAGRASIRFLAAVSSPAPEGEENNASWCNDASRMVLSPAASPAAATEATASTERSAAPSSTTPPVSIRIQPLLEPLEVPRRVNGYEGGING